MAIPAVAAMSAPEEVLGGLTAAGFMPGHASALTGLVNMLRQAVTGLSEFVHE